MDVATLMAKQVRIERQDTPNVSAVSFDRFAAHSFQAYVQSALAFSIKRCGLLYGRLDDDKVVFVDAVYEPEQQGKAETITYDFSTEQVTSSCTCDAI
jgi:nuclear protein localization protein 4 homolog